MTHSISLQPILAKEEIELLSSLILSPISSDLPPLQVVQYQFLCKWFDKGEIGWAEFLLLSAGGAGSVPSPNTSYAMLIIFHLGCRDPGRPRPGLSHGHGAAHTLQDMPAHSTNKGISTWLTTMDG
ncbi:hypothetical protein V8E53_002246 [Lactarius tabidus]